MLNFDIQNHRPLREIVYEELKMQILTGEIKPGTRMMEVELAEDMGVSRTPIREAIRKLEKEGLVIIEPRRGAYASEASIEDMVSILEVREELEGLAASLAAQRMTENYKNRLIEAAEGFKQALVEGDTEKLIQEDTLFHHIIVDATENKVLVNMVEQLQERVLRFRYLYYSDFKRAEMMPAEHQEIIEGILSGDSKVARAAAEVHIERLKELVITEGV